MHFLHAPSKRSIILLSILIVLLGGIFFRNFDMRRQEYRQFTLLQLEYNSSREYLSQQPNALVLLDQYQQALEHASPNDTLKGTIDWDLLLTHLRKAKLFRLKGDIYNYMTEGILGDQIIQHHPGMIEMFRTMSPEEYLTMMDNKERESASVAKGNESSSKP